MAFDLDDDERGMFGTSVRLARVFADMYSASQEALIMIRMN
jgi:hypothetical protein